MLSVKLRDAISLRQHAQAESRVTTSDHRTPSTEQQRAPSDERLKPRPILLNLVTPTCECLGNFQCEMQILLICPTPSQATAHPHRQARLPTANNYYAYLKLNQLQPKTETGTETATEPELGTATHNMGPSQAAASETI